MTIYEQKTDDYLPYSDATYRDIVRRILSSAPSGAKVLELGCGSGAFTRFIAENEKIASITGIDASQSLINIANSVDCAGKAKFEVVFFDDKLLKSIDFEEYDVILLTAFLHHLDEDFQARLISQIASSMRDGGILSLFEPNRDSPAILLQYLYETKLNIHGYDVSEFPVSASEIVEKLTGFRETSVYYMDVEYRSDTIMKKRIRKNFSKKIKVMMKRIFNNRDRIITLSPSILHDSVGIRYGESGMTAYRQLGTIFDEYRRLMKKKHPSNPMVAKDYFLLTSIK